MIARQESRRFGIHSEVDIVLARSAGRELSQAIGFSLVDCTQVATAVSELARNIVIYAGGGTIIIRIVGAEGETKGVEVLASDNGPGIADLDLVMRDGYSTTRGLGLGLPGTRRLMDEFAIRSEVGQGTEIRTVKWNKQ